MTFQDIIDGINKSTCKLELDAHLELTDLAVENDVCDYDMECWELISRACKSKMYEFDERIYH